MSPFESPEVRFDYEGRHFKQVQTSQELVQTVRQWMLPRNSKERIRAQPFLAFNTIGKVLKEFVRASSSNPIFPSKKRLEEDDKYDVLAAIEGAWELSQNFTNRDLLAGEVDFIAAIVDILRMVSRKFETRLAETLSGLLWNLSMNSKCREILRRFHVESLLSDIFIARGHFDAEEVPRSHLFALGALRALLCCSENNAVLNSQQLHFFASTLGETH